MSLPWLLHPQAATHSHLLILASHLAPHTFACASTLYTSAPLSPSLGAGSWPMYQTGTEPSVAASPKEFVHSHCLSEMIKANIFIPKLGLQSYLELKLNTPSQEHTETRSRERH